MKGILTISMCLFFTGSLAFAGIDNCGCNVRFGDSARAKCMHDKATSGTDKCDKLGTNYTSAQRMDYYHGVCMDRCNNKTVTKQTCTNKKQEVINGKVVSTKKDIRKDANAGMTACEQKYYKTKCWIHPEYVADPNAANQPSIATVDLTVEKEDYSTYGPKCADNALKEQKECFSTAKSEKKAAKAQLKSANEVAEYVYDGCMIDGDPLSADPSIKASAITALNKKYGYSEDYNYTTCYYDPTECK